MGYDQIPVDLLHKMASTMMIIDHKTVEEQQGMLIPNLMNHNSVVVMMWQQNDDVEDSDRFDHMERNLLAVNMTLEVEESNMVFAMKCLMKPLIRSMMMIDAAVACRR